MIDFVNTTYLYLLLLIPLLAGLFYLSRRLQRKRLSKFGNPSVLAHLMPDVSKYMPTIKMILSLVIVGVLVFMIARPFALNDNSDDTEKRISESGMEIMVCVDVSNSMLASSTDDPGGTSRIQRTRLILEKLLKKLTNDKIGLVVFAGDAYLQLPITADFVTAKLYLDNIDPGIVPTQGTAIGSAIERAQNSFSSESEFPKAIVVITDGENFEDDAIAAARQAKKAGIRVDVIGVGTAKGAPIPVGGGRFMTDADGKDVITKLNAEEAEEIAKAGGGIYISGNANDAVEKLAENLSDFSRKDYQRVFHSSSSEQFPILAWIALILLILDIFVVSGKISWLRKINFFSK